MNETDGRRARAWKRWLGPLAMGYLLAVSLACGSSGGDTTEEEEEAPATIHVLRANYGTALSPQQQITTPVTEFAPTDPVCISVEIEGRPRSGTVTLRWPLGAENVEAQVDLADLNGSVIWSAGQTTYVGGTLSHQGMLPPGQHETIVLYQGVEVGRYPYQVAAPPASIAGPYTTEPTVAQPSPPVVNPLPSATPVIYGHWVHPAVPASEHITFALVAVSVGEAAPPMTQVSSAELDATVAGPMNGPLQFSLPRPWPPGAYRMVGSGNTLGQFATLDFTIQ
ncbi:MAG: hypothetical protein H6719_31545 [Sandaracinaceae bacterium]|nr:hypothetical protein [Sandaracinaceae bacterium]